MADADAPGTGVGTVLILAAGFGRRFGTDKRRATIVSADGLTQPLLVASAYCYAALGWPLQLVLRPEDRALADDLSTRFASDPALPSLTPVFAEQGHLGMGHSLAAGAAAATVRAAPACLVALGDMPFVQPSTLTLMAAQMLRVDRPAISVVRPRYQGTPGNPVGFSAAALPTLARQSGDQGAREQLRRWQALTRWVDVDDAGILRDIDLPEDLTEDLRE